VSIRIVTDSTNDLPEQVTARLGIVVVPLYINFGLESFRDGVDLSREAFYARLPDSDPLPTTSMPGPEAFLQVYEDLASEGATEVLSIHISKSLSATIDAARAAAPQASIPVTVLDSGSLSLGTGFLAQTAAEAATEGLSMAEIVALLQDQTQRTHVFAALDTLEFLQRSGRMNRVMAALGSWLQVKPLLKMHDGNPTAEKVRTSETAMQRLVDLLVELGPLERVALVHTHALGRIEHVRRKAQYILPSEAVLSVDITPVLGTHLGPGAVGFVCVCAQGE